MRGLAPLCEFKIEDSNPFIKIEVEYKILIDQRDGKSTAKEVQNLIVEDPVRDESEREDDERGSEQVAVGLKVIRPRLGRLNITQCGNFEEGEDYSG